MSGQCNAMDVYLNMTFNTTVILTMQQQELNRCSAN